jgi:hypothetical protein
MKAPETGKGTKKDQTMEWLKQTLQDEGKIDAAELYRMADGRNITRATLNRAADKLNVVKDLQGFGKNKKSWWSLPSEDEEEAPLRHAAE